jgi:hypothetical protein
LYRTDPFMAGYLSPGFCTLLIWKGCLFFALNRLLGPFRRKSEAD